MRGRGKGSVQNRILTTLRNRLGLEKQRKLMIIKVNASDRREFRFDDALEHLEKKNKGKA